MVKKNKILILLLFFSLVHSFLISQNFPLKFSRADDNQNQFGNGNFKNNNCESRKTIEEVRTYFTGCTFNNDFYLYPVLVENFDYKEDLPNNWNFNLNWSLDDFADEIDTTINLSDGETWMGMPEGGFNNVFVNNGICELRWEKETVIGKKARIETVEKDYLFTGAMLYSIFKLKQGVFEARIKLPENPNFWPAYWLYDKPQEIDVFEFYDNDIRQHKNCDKYNQCKMSLHSGVSDNECNRGDKFPMNISDFHVYKLDWNKYEISIYVDGQKKGYATKYYDKLKLDQHCEYGTADTPWDPLYSYNCETLQGLEDNWYEIHWPKKPKNWPNWLPWSNIPDFLYYPNKVWVDDYFPSSDRPMSVYLNSGINRVYNGNTFSDFNEIDDLTMSVDWIKIYQPFCCNESKTLFNLNNFDYLTNYTGFLTGSTLKVGDISQHLGANFKQEKPSILNNWRDIPFFLLATEEIQITSEAIFEGDVYTEMRITECVIESNKTSSSSDLSNKAQISLNSEKATINDDEGNITINNKEVLIYPIPTTNELNINFHPNNGLKIINLEIFDLKGDAYNYELMDIIYIGDLNPGYYQLKLSFSDGSYLLKSIIKL